MGQARESVFDLRQAEAQLLGDEGEGQPPDVRAGEAPLVSRRARRFDQPLGFVEADRGDRKPGPASQFADGQQGLGAGLGQTKSFLDLKLA